VRFVLAFYLALVSLPAWAGAQLVAMPPLVADGSTTGTVRLFIDDGSRPKVKSDAGKVGPVVVGADGVVTFPFTPTRATSAGKAVLKVTTASGEELIDVPVVPPFGGSVELAFDPPVASVTTPITVKLTPSQGSPVASERRTFLVTASTGTVSPPAPTGDGTWIARYTPPKGLAAPTAVVFSAADASAPSVVTGYGVMPLTVRKSVSFDAPAGASCVLYLGDRQYGPIVASPAGKVAFDVDLDPRRPTGRLAIVNADTSREDREVTLPDAAKAVVSFIATPPAVPGAAAAFPVRVIVLGPDGAPRNQAPLKVTVTGGAVTEAKQTGDVYEVLYTPPTTAGEVTLSAEVEGIKTDRKMKILPSMGSVALTVEPTELAKGATSVKVTARVKDAAGTGVVGRPPAFTAVGGTAGTPKDNKDGSYTSTVTTSSSSTLVRIYAAPQLEASGLAPTRLILWPATSSVAANGKDEVVVNVIAVDAYGLPVPNVELKLGVPKGDGGLPPIGKTDARGVARLTYKAGTQSGLASLRAEGAGLVAEAPLFQIGSGMAPAVPVGGPPDVEGLLAKLQAATPDVVIVRAGSAPLSGPPAMVQIATVPPYTTPGAAILVTVRVADSAGKGVAAQRLAITAAPGNVGPITDNHDGTYSFALQLPAGQDGPVNINVGAASATGTVLLPRLGDAATMQPQAGTGGAVRTGGTPVAGTGGARATRGAAPASDKARLRLGATLVNSRGSFDQSGNGKEQLLGAVNYKTPGAGFTGLHGDVVFWAVDAGWGGLAVDGRVNGQLELYKVLGESYASFPFDVAGGLRYRKSMGVLGLGGGLGVHYLSGTLFRYKDAALAEAALLTYPTLGVRVAPGLAVETDTIYFTAEIAETFVPFPVSTHAEGQFEYTLPMGLGLRGGVAWDYRTMAFETKSGAGTADVKQSQVQILLGVGYKI